MLERANLLPRNGEKGNSSFSRLSHCENTFALLGERSSNNEQPTKGVRKFH
jgi:hypothetical protein